jgi:tetratricopeptide (TPR) repeat protein
VPKTITAGTGDSYPSQMARGVLLEDYLESLSELTACIPSATSKTHRVPLPLSEVLLRTGLAGPRVSATESIRSASTQTPLIEDCRPIAKSLECRLAMGLNFPLLEEHFTRGGVTVLKPDGDEGSAIQARLLFRGALPSTRRVFEVRFAATAREHADAPIAQARQEAASSRLRQALASYRIAIVRNPRDWQLIGEAAEFVSTQLKDHEAGLELAHAALELNPWYSSRLWNVLGDCLTSLQRPRDAHECHLQAQRINPDDVDTNLKLAETWLALGDPRRSLEAAARGLANDSDALLRHVLLEKQQQAIASLTVR